ncbi:MAG: B12-binding domain-containing radical SAM protein [Deltaproteobacteria bacterium]|nr:B12-binding domain-containing radical SAM protein [Deltaproteobacteria bacterium]
MERSQEVIMAKVLFAQEIYFPFQSTARLSASLKKAGHRVSLAIGDEQKIVTTIKKEKPDLIAFSVLTPYRNHMLLCANAIKRAGIKTPVIAGGYDITFLPQILAHSDLDIICMGEGEAPLHDLCRCIDNHEDYRHIANLWVKEGGVIFKNRMRQWVMNMDELPFDDRDLYFDYDSYFKIIPFTQVLVGRGCPYPCSYCFNDGYRKLYKEAGSSGYCNLRSVDNLMAELKILKAKYNARYIFFNDSTLTYNKKWLFEFLTKYKAEIGIPFSLNAVITEIDEDVGKALKENGWCELVRFGLETGNEEFRKTVLRKNISNQQLINGTGILKKNNIRYSMAMMLGLPGETLDLCWETLLMAKKISAKDSVHAINIFKPFPGLDITDYGIKIGQYKRDDIASHELPESLKRERGQNPAPLADNFQNLALGTRDLCFFENYRIDKEGQLLLKLSRFSHLAIRFSFLRPLIRLLVKLPDNFAFRFIWKSTEAFLNIRAHANVPLSFFVKYFLFHRGKKIR